MTIYGDPLETEKKEKQGEDSGGRQEERLRSMELEEEIGKQKRKYRGTERRASSPNSRLTGVWHFGLKCKR